MWEKRWKQRAASTYRCWRARGGGACHGLGGRGGFRRQSAGEEKAARGGAGAPNVRCQHLLLFTTTLLFTTALSALPAPPAIYYCFTIYYCFKCAASTSCYLLLLYSKRTICPCCMRQCAAACPMGPCHINSCSSTTCTCKGSGGPPLLMSRSSLVA